MNIKMNQIIESYIKQFEGKNLIVSSIEIKENYNNTTKEKEHKYYVNLSDQTTFEIVLTIGIPEMYVSQLKSNMFKPVKLENFKNLNYGSHRQSQYEIAVWIKADSFINNSSTNV